MLGISRRPWYQNPLRWNGENDWWLGPFTFSRSNYGQKFGLIFASFGGGEDDDRPASMRLTLGRNVLIVRLPQWLVPGPTVTRTYPNDPAWKAPDGEVFKRLGRSYYETADEHEYGFDVHRAGTVGDAWYLSIKYGRSTHDSSTDKSWGCFLPWTDWRHVRWSCYDLDGKLFGQVLDGEHPKMPMFLSKDGKPSRYDIQRDLEAKVPKKRFVFTDFDGEQLIATTHIEEREWRAGTGWFKWLQYLRRRIVRRSLSIEFSGETGKRKGSWKGGTTGTGVDMRQDDTHLTAFLRYCKENNMEWKGWADV